MFIVESEGSPKAAGLLACDNKILKEEILSTITAWLHNGWDGFKLSRVA